MSCECPAVCTHTGSFEFLWLNSRGGSPANFVMSHRMTWSRTTATLAWFVCVSVCTPSETKGEGRRSGESGKEIGREIERRPNEYTDVGQPLIDRGAVRAKTAQDKKYYAKQ